MTASPDLQAHYRAAAARARPVLRRGDRVRMIAHGSDRAVTYTFEAWDETSPSGQFFISRSGVDELHPFNITAVNGQPMTFRNPGA